MNRREAEEALEVDVRDLHVNIRCSLGQDSPAAAFSVKEDALHFRQQTAPPARRWKKLEI
jgi:hypothetical protein